METLPQQRYMINLKHSKCHEPVVTLYGSRLPLHSLLLVTCVATHTTPLHVDAG